MYSWLLKLLLDLSRTLFYFYGLVCAMIHTSGLLRVTDVIKDLRGGVVTIVTLLVDWRNDYSACSTLTCFRGFLHYDMTRSVWWQRM